MSIPFVLAAVVALPFAFRAQYDALREYDDVLAVVTPPQRSDSPRVREGIPALVRRADRTGGAGRLADSGRGE